MINAERDHDGPRVVGPERVVQQPALQHVADEEHDDDRDDARPEQRQPERLDDEERDERGEDAEVAVREVDHAHDPEHQSQAGREQGVEPAQKDPLDCYVGPDHGVTSRSTRR
jgi:hypothetical protein